MADKKQKLELRWHGKDKWESPEPRLLIEEEIYQGEKKGIDDNLLIYGDNLLGLKALERDYTGKVKCIYIDPPYNTKSCFKHYNDNLEHSLWLNMMKERLVIMHKLLKEDGTIWISIDDDECHYLKVMCDEIFGRKNFVANVIWEKKYSPQNDAKYLSDTHDHLLVYAKNVEKSNEDSLWRLPRTAEMDARYKNLDCDSRGSWKASDLSVKRVTPKDIYAIRTPSGRETWPPEGRSWSVSKETYKKLEKDKRIWFGPNGNNVPSLKRFLSEVQDGVVSKTIWGRNNVGDNQEAKREVIAINPKDVFSTPKPERLIYRILHLATNPGDLVLDSFAGSGTTGAVAHKMKRRWIMIEFNGPCHSHIIPRLTKVIDGDDPGGITEQVDWKGGGGFRYCEMAPSLLEKNRLGRWTISKKYNPAMLSEAVCLHAGYKHAPKRDPYWMHGYSTENDFIYVTSQTLTRAFLERLSEEVGEDRSLMVYCGAFKTDGKEFENLTVRKIPKAILNKCTWGKDDYSLKVALTKEAEVANRKKRVKRVPVSTGRGARAPMAAQGRSL